VIAEPTPRERALGAWMRFWFPPASLGQLALLRIGVGLVLLFALFVASFDVQAHYSLDGWGDPLTLRGLDPTAWPFSVFDWFGNDFWLWVVHVLALLAALAFLLGVLPLWNGALTIVFLLSYLHRNPAVALGFDGLLLLGVFYLALTPCGRAFSVLAGVGPAVRPTTPLGHPDEAPGPVWAGFPLRLLQLHLSLLYFFSGLAKLTPEWLAGVVFWHPRVAETGLPIAYEFMAAHPQLTVFVIYGAVLFQLFFPVIVWMPRFRYAMLGVAVVVHLAVGILWGKLAFNLLLLVLDFAFVPPQHVDRVLEEFVPLLERRRPPSGRGQ
jgi:hypothetical protein